MLLKKKFLGNSKIQCDAIIHLAGENRPKNIKNLRIKKIQELFQININSDSQNNMNNNLNNNNINNNLGNNIYDNNEYSFSDDESE